MVLGGERSAWVQSHDRSRRSVLSIYDAPMRAPKGFSITLSPYRGPRSTPCGRCQVRCLYPKRALPFRAQARGFDNAVVCECWATCRTRHSTLMAKMRGVTPVRMGLFSPESLRRVIGCCARACERWSRKSDYADLKRREIFASGTIQSRPSNRIGGAHSHFGPLFSRARESIGHSHIRDRRNSEKRSFEANAIARITICATRFWDRGARVTYADIRW